MKFLEVLMWILIASVVVLTLYFITVGFQTATINELCLQYGWDKGMMDLDFTGYCIRKVDGHETIKQLDEIMKEQ